MRDLSSSMREFLRVDELNAWYGESHVLHGMSFAVGEGELVTLLGRNGAGKTTTLRAIIGIIGQRQGSIAFRGTQLISLPSHQIARLGIAYCPEERGIFASLDVEENLLLPPALLAGGMSIEEIYAIFPNLRERRRSQGTKLSGGEQQMLAIGKERGFTILLVEQNFRFAATIADRHYIVENGRAVDMIRNEELASNIGKLHEYLGV
jgi:branched-chain amino acid transport system ATP-binding protein